MPSFFVCRCVTSEKPDIIQMRMEFHYERGFDTLNDETKNKLMNAIKKHNDEQTNPQDKVDLREILMEIGNMKSDELEKAAKRMQEDLETRGQ